MARPSGSAPSHDLHRSPAFGMIEPVPGVADPPDTRGTLAGGVLGVANIEAGGALCRAEARGGAAGAVGADRGCDGDAACDCAGGWAGGTIVVAAA